MRFAYIDSQGNEVTIPSVDALALRIELGAIVPDTQLYDAQADRWGPAHTHEIFHTLSRSVADEGAGFVAPPPPVAPPPAAASPETPAPEPEPEPEPEAPAPPEPEAERELDLDFTLTEAPAESATPETEGAAGPQAPEAPSDAPDEAGMNLDFDLTAEPGAPAGESPTPSAESPGDDELLDFGAGGALELEPSLADEPGVPEVPPVERDALVEPPLAEDESFLDFSSPGGAMDLELEQPLSEFTSDAPPSWMEQDGPGGDSGPDDAMDFSRPSEDAPAPPVPERHESRPGPPQRERPAPRSRPSPPRRPSKFPWGAILGGIVTVVVVGGGGYLGWQQIQARRASRAAANPELPEVTIPTIPEELMPTMRELGDQAMDGLVAQFRTREAGLDLPAEPRSDWLAGVYLANASQFPDIQAYWEGIGSFVDLVRDNDTQVFDEQYAARLAAAGITGERAAMLRARADSGFLSTRTARFESYALMDDLVRAALDLHRFLLDNEASIAYEPAAGGVSRDPVLEAVPSSDELGNRMWGMVDRITEALDALGTLDKVTTDRLVTVLLDKVHQAGFR